MYKTKIYQMTAIGLMAALTCVFGPMALNIPISPVPISLTNLVIFFSVYILGWKAGCTSYLVYLFLGLAGLPVFSGYTGGAGKLLGPTGGYLIGFIFMAAVSGLLFERFHKRTMDFFGMILGTALAYLFGTAWLAWQAQMKFAEAMVAGVIPFIPGDLVKIILILMIGPEVRRRLNKAGISFYKENNGK